MYALSSWVSGIATYQANHAQVPMLQLIIVQHCHITGMHQNNTIPQIANDFKLYYIKNYCILMLHSWLGSNWY